MNYVTINIISVTFSHDYPQLRLQKKLICVREAA